MVKPSSRQYQRDLCGCGRFSLTPRSRLPTPVVEPSRLRTAVFSIISPNYRHYARVLMESVRRHQAEWDRFVLLVDDGDAIDEELFETVSLDALPLPNRRQFYFRYTMLELNT